MDELASPKYEQCYYSNITYEHSGFRFQIINGTLFVDHLPWHNYEGGVVTHALTPDPYNVYVLSIKCALAPNPYPPVRHDAVQSGAFRAMLVAVHFRLCTTEVHA